MDKKEQTNDFCGCRFDGKQVQRTKCPAHRFSRMTLAEVKEKVFEEAAVRFQNDENPMAQRVRIYELVLKVLEKHENKCLDNALERQAIAVDLAKALQYAVVYGI